MASRTMKQHGQAGAGSCVWRGSSAVRHSSCVVACSTLGPALRAAQQQPAMLYAALQRQHQRAVVLARAQYKRNMYTDFNDNLGSLDSLEQFDSSFGWSTPPPQQRDFRDDYPPPRNNNYYSGYVNTSRFNVAQQRASYVNNWSLDEMEEDDYEGPPLPEDDGFATATGNGSKQRTVNGRELLINTEIMAPVVRVIAGDGGKVMKGIMNIQDALSLAREARLDLVLLNADAQPPLCRLVVWSKYKYEVEKEQKKNASKAIMVETKEVRLRPNTDAGDLKTKLKAAQKFLEKGNKVKLVMKFEGRELQYKEQGKALMLKFVEDLGVFGKVDGPINFKTGAFTALLSPTARAAGQEAPAPPAPTAPAPPTAAAAGLTLPPPLPPLPLPPVMAAQVPPQPQPQPVWAAAAPTMPAPPPLPSSPSATAPSPLPMPPNRVLVPAGGAQRPALQPTPTPPTPPSAPLGPALLPLPPMPPGQGATLGTRPAPAARPAGVPMPPPPPPMRPLPVPGLLIPVPRQPAIPASVAK